MLPLSQRIAFVVFAILTLAAGLHGFYRLYRRVRRGRADTDARWNQVPQRLWYALVTTLTQSRTFRKRPWVSFFHSLIFYGFVFYLLVNAVDLVDGFHELPITSASPLGATYLFIADVLSALVMLGVLALVVRRFALPSRRDFRFNETTLLHENVRHGTVTRDSIIVSAFILLHVGSRAAEMGAVLTLNGRDHYQPFASLLAHAFTARDAYAWRIAGFWGALGSVFAFLAYFPYSKHVHIFMAPAKYAVARDQPSGVLPVMDVGVESDDTALGAGKLEELAWPRLLDAYACIQCNRCQDVCPATATGKSLSPSALEINKRMELNTLASTLPAFEKGAPSPRPLLQFALTPEAAWACTTCGACMQACPVQDEPMLDIIDIRRQQVMMEGAFPAQLQSAFRGMERAKNPWGIAPEQRLAWADGLRVRTIAENPEPDVLYWVGCAASYDPQAQKTARAFVQLLDHAGVNFAVLGKQECCTGDSARRAGNEYLYRQLAETNVETLARIRPKQIVATCPHCLNSIGKEYRQLGGEFDILHHTQFLDGLVAAGKLQIPKRDGSVAYHDPCYLGRHNGIYEQPRSLLNVLSNDVRELDRTRENSFCCGAGGAQFWKEEEPGAERISDNRYREAERTLASGTSAKTLAVGCPFCKSMLQSTPGKGDSPVAVKDVAELLWESVSAELQPAASLDTGGSGPQIETVPEVAAHSPAPALQTIPVDSVTETAAPVSVPTVVEPATRAKWTPRRAQAPLPPEALQAPDQIAEEQVPQPPQPARKKWAPKASGPSADPAPQESTSEPAQSAATPEQASQEHDAPGTARKKWTPPSKRES